MILCEKHGYVWRDKDRECPHCASNEYPPSQSPMLVLGFEVERLRDDLARVTADLARVSAERDGLQRALDVSKDTAAGFMSTEQLRVFLGVVRIAIAACAPPASEEENER